MTDKVKLPKGVAEAIEYYSRPELDYTKYGILDNIVGDSSDIAVKARRELIFHYTEGPCWDVLMKALVNGYEIEETPEDKVRAEYEESKRRRDVAKDEFNKEWWDGRRDGFVVTLNILNIKIEGVNA